MCQRACYCETIRSPPTAPLVLPQFRSSCDTSSMKRRGNQVDSDLMTVALIAGFIAFTAPNESIVLIGWSFGLLAAGANRLFDQVVK